MSFLFPFPDSNSLVTWSSMTSVPDWNIGLVAKGSISGYSVPWEYAVHKVNEPPTTPPSGVLYVLRVQGYPESGTKTSYFFLGTAKSDLVGAAESWLTFSPRDSEAPLPEMPVVGGSCAARNMYDARINGRAACVSGYYYPNYALRLASVVGAGAVVGSLLNKKKRSKGALVGALLGTSAAIALWASGLLRPGFVYKESI